MRQYQAIWEQIKLTGTCEISCIPEHVRRIKKAVTKEKDIDPNPLWQHKRLTMSHTINDRSARVRFVLVARLDSLALI